MSNTFKYTADCFSAHVYLLVNLTSTVSIGTHIFGRMKDWIDTLTVITKRNTLRLVSPFSYAGGYAY